MQSEDFVGTVELIGLRSTRIRTLDRTLIAIPNGRLAEMRLESFTARDRLRLACMVGLVYGTSVDPTGYLEESSSSRNTPLVQPKPTWFSA